MTLCISQCPLNCTAQEVKSLSKQLNMSKRNRDLSQTETHQNSLCKDRGGKNRTEYVRRGKKLKDQELFQHVNLVGEE